MKTIKKDGWTFGTRENENIYFGYSPEGANSLLNICNTSKKELVYSLENFKKLEFENTIPKFGKSHNKCISTSFGGRKYFVKYYNHANNSMRKGHNGYNELLALYLLDSELKNLNELYGNKTTKIDIVKPLYGSVNLRTDQSIIIYPFLDKINVVEEYQMSKLGVSILSKINDYMDWTHDIRDIKSNNTDYRVQASGEAILAIFDPITDIYTPEFHNKVFGRLK